MDVNKENFIAIPNLFYLFAGMRVGYARVSTDSQTVESQIEILEGRGKCEHVYSEVKSGKNMDRPEFRAMLDFIRPGDTIVVIALDRIGRSLIEVVEFIEEMRANDIKLESLSQPVDWESAYGRFVVKMTLLFAELEREMMLERQKRGLEYARSQGRIGGRRKGERKADVKAVAKRYHEAIKTAKTKQEALKIVASEFGIGAATVNRYIKE